jgi:hypothetical protein
MGVYVRAYQFDGQITERIALSFTQKEVYFEPAISVGQEKTDAINLTRGSYELYMEKEDNSLSLDFSYISQGFLFKGAGIWSFIPLTKNQCESNFRKILVVFKKPQNFEVITYEPEKNLHLEKIISGYKGKFNECAILLHQGKILKVTFSGKSNKTYYLLFDGKDLKTLTWGQVFFGSIQRKFLAFV